MYCRLCRKYCFAGFAGNDVTHWSFHDLNKQKYQDRFATCVKTSTGVITVVERMQKNVQKCKSETENKKMWQRMQKVSETSEKVHRNYWISLLCLHSTLKSLSNTQSYISTKMSKSECCEKGNIKIDLKYR